MATMKEKLLSSGPREAFASESALIALLNHLDSGWGDHFRQALTEGSGSLPVDGNKDLDKPDAVVDVYVRPDGETDEFGEAVTPDEISFVEVMLEFRERGEESARQAVTVKMPCDRDYRITAEEDEALTGFLAYCKQSGASAIEDPSHPSAMPGW